MAGRSQDWTVKIAFDLSANGVGSWFTLDDTTKGVLDSATYLLAGDVLVDVTNKVQRLTIRRGRSRMLDKFTAGAANITLLNTDRSFDPTYTTGPYYGQLVPRKEVSITHAGQPVFSGNVEDWNLGYSKTGIDTAEPSCADGLSYLARQTVSAGTSTSEASGARITALLDMANWPSAKRSVQSGTRTMAADVRNGSENLLSYAQKVETSEHGALFVAKDGTMVFRQDNPNPTATGITFGTGGIPFIDYSVQYGTEAMWNTVDVSYYSGSVSAASVFTAQDSTSISNYGVFDQRFDTFLTSSTAASGLATEILSGYANPKYRIDSISVDMAGISSAQRLQVLGLELTDVVQVTWTPQGTGNAVSETVTIDGIEHNATQSSYIVTFRLSET